MFYTTETSDQRRSKDGSSRLCALGPWVPRCSFSHGHISTPAGLSVSGRRLLNGHPWHQAVTIEVVILAIHCGVSGNALQFETKSTRSATSDYVITRLLRLDPSSVDLGKAACINDSMLASRLKDFRPGTRILYGARHEASVWRDPR